MILVLFCWFYLLTTPLLRAEPSHDTEVISLEAPAFSTTQDLLRSLPRPGSSRTRPLPIPPFDFLVSTYPVMDETSFERSSGFVNAG